MRNFQQVPVPEEYVTRVMAYIARLEGHGDGDDDTAAEEAMAAQSATDVADPKREWTTEELRRIAKGKNFTTKVLTQMLDALAEAPGEWFTSAELADRVGQKQETIRRLWTHVSRHINKWYAGAPWPLEAKWGPEFDSAREALVYYRLNDAQAAKWKAARTDPDT